MNIWPDDIPCEACGTIIDVGYVEDGQPDWPFGRGVYICSGCLAKVDKDTPDEFLYSWRKNE